MPTAHFESLLESSVAEVLESMCFLFIEPDAPFEMDGCIAWVSRRLDFQGPSAGSFGVRVPRSTARVIASNLLGQEQEECSDLQSAEAVGEIANMICGTFLSRLDSRRAFDLSSPFEDVVHGEPEPSVGRVLKMFTLDCGLLVAWVEIKTR